ncbi:MAG: hypothetical protein U0166_24565 [Acidobacteriota bacterium]
MAALREQALRTDLKGVPAPGNSDVLDGKKVTVVMPRTARMRSRRPRRRPDGGCRPSSSSTIKSKDTVRKCRGASGFLGSTRRTAQMRRRAKTCWEALRRGADIVVMVHPDCSTPELIPALAACIPEAASTTSPPGSRILNDACIADGMPSTSTSPTAPRRSWRTSS